MIGRRPYCAKPGCTRLVRYPKVSNFCQICRSQERTEVQLVAEEVKMSDEPRGILLVDERGRTVDSARWVMRAMRGGR